MQAQILDIATSAAMLYAVAAGLLVIFGVMKIINFAHGAFLTLGGYCALLTTWAGISPWLAFPVAAIVGFIIGALVERFIVRPLYQRPLDAILATWGLGIILGQVITLIFGREVQFVQSPVQGTALVLDTDYSLYRLLLVPGAILVGVALAALLHGTRLGLAARAVIMNEALARGLGIDSDRVRSLTFGLGSALAALAGALITPLSSVDPAMGVPWLVNAFMLVMVAGRSLISLMVATVVLGGAQVLVSSYASPVLGGLTIAVLAAIILRIRPQGFARD
ncbi:MAG: branched-chain amino acid ABC transporter permease [Azospirillaceae bacterium]|nr:branched-chain amino acid ABC transporter permease [Azospirillaceae bacterium]